MKPACLPILVLAAACSAPVSAQTHRVEAPEKVTRAVAVYEWTGDLAKPTSSRLVPVSLFIDGRFQDAGTYYARPVPLALLDGNVYSLEKAGIAQGNFTLRYARHLQAPTSGAPETTASLGWFGYGVFTALPAERKAPPLQASRTQPEITGTLDNTRPTLHNKSGSSSGTAGSGSRKRSADDSSVSAAGTSADDPDRPHFGKKPADDKPADTKPADTGSSSPQADSTTPKSSTASTPSAGDDTDRPTLRHRDPKQAEADRKARDRASVTAPSGSLGVDPDRPTMRRGPTAETAGAPSQLSGIPTDLHQMIATSDAVTREPHDFARRWDSPAEESDVRAHMAQLAQAQLADYVRQNGLGGSAAPAPAGPRSRGAHATAARTGSSAPAAPLTLGNESLRAFTLSYGGLPTFVYSASVAPASGMRRPELYVTVVAQRLASGELQVALSSATDAAHLDRTPWMRLIDVVDPDAGHRAHLVFELRGQTARQFALYRILSARAEQVFTTAPGE